MKRTKRAMPKYLRISSFCLVNLFIILSFFLSTAQPYWPFKKKQPKRFRDREKTIERPLSYIDTHDHLSGWAYRKGSLAEGFEKAAQVAIDTMDKEGIKIMLLMPTPQTVNQHNRHKMSDYLDVAKKYPNRFALLGGGGTLNVFIQESLIDGEVSLQLQEKFKKTAEDIIAQGAVGFGEMTAEHFSMDQNHPYVSASPDHPLFLLLADIAAKYDVPIDIHMEAVPQDMEMPERLQRMKNNPRVVNGNIEAFKRLLSHNPRAKIVWAHAGWDNTGYRTTELSKRLLEAHPNLYMSIRVGPKSIASRPTDESGKINPEWLELILEHPDRFMIGSDEFLMPQKRGGRHASATSITNTVNLLSELPSDVAKKVGFENALKLYKLKDKYR